MTDFAQRLKKCREDKKKENPVWTQNYVAKKIGVARSTYTAYENGTKMPPFDTINSIADLFNVKTDFLMGRTNNPIPSDDLPVLTEKEERDIIDDFEDMLNNLDSKGGYAAYDGRSAEEVDEEDKELLRASILNSMRLAKRIAKQKFTPDKYKK